MARPQDRKFLGFSFTGGKGPNRRIATKALLRCKRRVRELTRRTRGISLEQMTKELPAIGEAGRATSATCQTPLGVAWAGSMDTATIAIRDLEATEATQLVAPGE